MKISKNKLVKYSITSALALTLATGYLNNPNAKANDDKSNTVQNQDATTSLKQNNTANTKKEQMISEADGKAKTDSIAQGSVDEKAGVDSVAQGSAEGKAGIGSVAQESVDEKAGVDSVAQGSVDEKAGVGSVAQGSVDEKAGVGSVAQGPAIGPKNLKITCKLKNSQKNVDVQQKPTIHEQDDNVNKDYDQIPYIYEDSKVYFIKKGQKVDIEDNSTHLIRKLDDKIDFDYGLRLNKGDLSDDNNTYLYITNALKVNSEKGVENYDLKWTFSSVDSGVEEKNGDPMATIGLGNSEGHAPFLQIKDWSQRDSTHNHFIHTNMKFYKHDEELDNSEQDNHQTEDIIKKHVDDNNQLVKPNIYLQYYRVHDDMKFRFPSEQINKVIDNSSTEVSSSNDSTTISQLNGAKSDAVFLVELKNSNNGINMDVSVSQNSSTTGQQAITATKIAIVKVYHGDKLVSLETMSNYKGAEDKIKKDKIEQDTNSDKWVLLKVDNNSLTKDSPSDVSVEYKSEVNEINFYYVLAENVSKDFIRTVRYLDMKGNNIKNSYNEINNIKYIKAFNKNGEIQYFNEYGDPIAEEPKYEFSSFNIEPSKIEGYTFHNKDETKDENNNTLINLYYDKDDNTTSEKSEGKEKKETSSSEKTPSGNNEQPSAPAEDDAKIKDSQNNQSQGTIDINKKDNNNSESNTNSNAAPSNHRKERNQDDEKLAFNNKKSASNKITINGHKGNKSNSNNFIKRNNKNANKKAKINKSAKSNSVSSKDTPITINHQNKPASVVNNVNNDNVNKLPQTGEKSGIAYTLSGLAMLMVSIFTFVFRRNKNK
ncbi:LPXTG cell wall anchor domain-containing protein [Apilactobacillus sp. TMW 2.2459]|uniref:LPXTG cell wall anchor domain-containing protein n=1 Tax=Apilactobacillus xinyiensis TaxID=2841032 RepID=UPI00200EEE28|nr:LPXTG cell wall anchor domain-containing protein [Apilactobacillus xinyiensis]MCL0312735.1 LPXTG cell wall anchor domain-containing protein [Apilactobacillus xinyiensis]